MSKLIVLLIILIFMFIGYLVYVWMQHLIGPRRSPVRLLVYIIVVLIFVFVLSFLMVWVITGLYPNELMK